MMYNVRRTKSRGFTLIELLVVIAIIAILVAFAVANFVGARSRAQDVKKKAELQQIKNALRLYYNDFQSYPGPLSQANNSFDGCGSLNPPSDPCNGGSAFSAGTNVYMKMLPPASSYVWSYEQESGGDDFCLWTTLTNQSDSEINDSQTKCSVCNGVVGTSDYVVCAD